MSGSHSGDMRHGADSALAPADPSMQDILASIRRILSEDERPPAEPPPSITAPLGNVPAGVFRLDESMLVHPPPAMPRHAEAPSAAVVPMEAPPPTMPDIEPEGAVEADLVQMILGNVPTSPSVIPDSCVEPELPDMASPPPQTAPEPLTVMPSSEPDTVDAGLRHEMDVAEVQEEIMPDHAMTHAPDTYPLDLKPVAPGEPLVTAESAAATQSVVAGLMRQLSTERTTTVYRDGPTIEDLVREEMRPLLKYWLDTHLPPMVERLVRSELDRLIARAAP